MSETSQRPTKAEWYKDAIIYALQVQTFYDSNGDGCGDFRGVLEKLDYLEELGVTCLWLMPFYQSRGLDDGYDVVDYCAVDPKLGTEDDLRELLLEARRRGFRTIIELVVDHTSDQHEWFLKARSDTASPYRDYYIWSDTERHGPQVSGSIFPGEEDGVWTYDEEAGAYYFHIFYSTEPSLNNACPDVRKEIRHIIEHWSTFPIDGFRIDAASHILQDKPEKSTRPESFELLTEMCEATASNIPDGVAMAEADVEASEYGQYFDSVPMMLNFLLSQYSFLAHALGRSGPIRQTVEYLATTRKDGGQFVNFLRNADELDLERLHQEERDLVCDTLSPDEGQQIYNRGIRRRLAPLLGGDQHRIEMALSLLFSIPGTPLIFWGDELGVGDDQSESGRFAVRLPMPWSRKKNGGFSPASRSELLRCPIEKGPYSFKRLNVEAASKNPGSQLNFTRELIKLRRSLSWIGDGDFEAISNDDAPIMVHRVRCGAARLVAVHNLTREEHSVQLGDFDLDGAKLQLERGTRIASEEGGLHINLSPYGFGWFAAG